MSERAQAIAIANDVLAYQAVRADRTVQYLAPLAREFIDDTAAKFDALARGTKQLQSRNNGAMIRRRTNNRWREMARQSGKCQTPSPELQWNVKNQDCKTVYITALRRLWIRSHFCPC